MTFSAVLIFLFFSVILGNGDHDWNGINELREQRVGGGACLVSLQLQ